MLSDTSLFIHSQDVLTSDDANSECATSQDRFLARLDNPSHKKAIFALLDQSWNSTGKSFARNDLSSKIKI